MYSLSTTSGERVACLPSKREVLILLSIRESVFTRWAEPLLRSLMVDGADILLSLRPRGAEESCFLGALRSSNGPQWTPQEIIELRRSRLCPQGEEGFIYLILSYFSFCSGSKRRKSIQHSCDIFCLFLLVHLWQLSKKRWNGSKFVQRRKKRRNFSKVALRKRTSWGCEQQLLSHCADLRIICVGYTSRLTNMLMHPGELLVSRPEHLWIVSWLVLFSLVAISISAASVAKPCRRLVTHECTKSSLLIECEQH